MSVSTDSIRAVCAYLESKGISFICPTEPGVHEGICDTDGVMAFLNNPLEFNAQEAGVSVADYREWQEWGSPRCAGVTAKGKPCKGLVPNVGDCSYDAVKFAKHHRQQYCWVHGG